MGDRQVFIGNLCNISTEKLRSYCETYGPITELTLNRDKENNIYHCFAFVTFQSSRCTCQFLADRPHYLNGEEIFVKRALPRFNASIPERLIVTNRLVIQDCHKHDPHALRHYFQKFGHIKKFDYDQGLIDFDDYDHVDRILLGRPHFIRNREVLVTKYIPSDHSNKSTRVHHSHPQHHDPVEDDEDEEQVSYPSPPTREVKVPTEAMRISRTIRIERHSSKDRLIKEMNEVDEDDDQTDQSDRDHLHQQYQELQEKFEQYKQMKEIEICDLKLDLERTKRQLNDLTQDKLDLLIKNQQLLHQEFLVRFPLEETSLITRMAEDCIPSTPNKLAKKRKLTTAASIQHEYDYYS